MIELMQTGDNLEYFKKNHVPSKKFKDYLLHHSKYGPVRCLPTAVFFYGMENSQEIKLPEAGPKEEAH